MIAVFDEAYEGKPETPLHTNWNTKGDVDHLRKAFADYDPRLRRALDYVPADECRLWNILSLPDLPTWVSPSGNVVILGDAAHAMRPYLAQVNCALLYFFVAGLNQTLGRSNGSGGWSSTCRMSFTGRES
jgi:hypothetical protein